MQKIFVIRHETRERDSSWQEDYERLTSFLESELGNEGVEIYSSFEKVAYNTASMLCVKYLRDRRIHFKDDQLEGIGPYGKSQIKDLHPFPLFELTLGRIKKDSIDETAKSLINANPGQSNHIVINTNEMELEKALCHHSKENDYKNLPEIIGKTDNNVLLVTHWGIVEHIQQAWGFKKRSEDETPYLSGSIIMPEVGLCKEFSPVTKFEVIHNSNK